MSIVKIQQVRDLKAAVKYTTQDYKTNEQLVTSYECDIESIENDFKAVLMDYEEKTGTPKNMSARMIIQSFSDADNITPEQAHQYGVELADNYLKGNHQYSVITHIETDNIHNHIIFNSVDHNNLKMFDSKRQHTINDLRKENDRVSEKYKLSIIENTRQTGITFNEYVARAKNVSFKGKLEKVLDDAIAKSNSFDEFLKEMKAQGYECKQGKHLAFLNPKSNKYMRTKNLGMNYLESSIKYRIENKDYVPVKRNVIDKQWIDKKQQKFKSNKGLQKWATLQNINYLNELSTTMYKENKSLSDLQEIETNSNNLIDVFERKLSACDDEIYKLNKMINCFTVYQDSHSLILDYKAAEDKQQFKKDNYSMFKRFDTAKRDINVLKKMDITDLEGLKYKISMLERERNILYGSLTVGEEKTAEKAREQEQDRRKKREVER